MSLGCLFTKQQRFLKAPGSPSSRAVSRSSSLFLIDETVVETRLARLVDGRLVELKHYPHLPPAVDRAQAGDFYVARVTKAVRGINGTFVDLGTAGEGLLRTRSSPPQGSLVTALVVRPGYGAKLPILRPKDAAHDAEVQSGAPGRLAGAPDALEVAFSRALPEDRIVIDGDGVWRRAQAEAHSRPDLVLEHAAPDLFEREGVQAQIEEALDPVVTLPCGARLVIEETQALTAIDVDTARAPRAFEANIQAADEIPRQMAARSLAGNIVVDFAQAHGASDMLAIRSRLLVAAQTIDIDLEIGAAGRTGLVQIQRARSAAPLSAILTRAGLTHSCIPVALNIEAQSARLARAVRATSARLAGPLAVRVNADLHRWLTAGAGVTAWRGICTACPAPLQLLMDGDLSWGALEVDRREKGAS